MPKLFNPTSFLSLPQVIVAGVVGGVALHFGGASPEIATVLCVVILMVYCKLKHAVAKKATQVLAYHAGLLSPFWKPEQAHEMAELCIAISNTLLSSEQAREKGPLSTLNQSVKCIVDALKIKGSIWTNSGNQVTPAMVLGELKIIHSYLKNNNHTDPSKV